MFFGLKLSSILLIIWMSVMMFIHQDSALFISMLEGFIHFGMVCFVVMAIASVAAIIYLYRHT